MFLGARVVGTAGHIDGRSIGECPVAERLDRRQSGRSSGVEHNLAKVGVEGSNPFARSIITRYFNMLERFAVSGEYALCMPGPPRVHHLV